MRKTQRELQRWPRALTGVTGFHGRGLDWMSAESTAGSSVALLTGGDDRSYALGLATALLARGVRMDVIGSDEVDCPEFHGKADLAFLNLRGDQSRDASFPKKVF